MTQKDKINLYNFFIFNPGLSRVEGEEDRKILYYYPPNINKDTQLKSAGLCEALIKFSSSFEPNKPCDVFCTEKTKQLLYQPEENYWIAMTVMAEKSISSSSEDPCDMIQDSICNSILRLAYRMFTVFSGNFLSIVQDESEEGLTELRSTLDHFYNKYLPSIKFESINVLDAFQGIQYLPLGRQPFLHVLSFLNAVEVEFPCLKKSAFLYNDHLVWSGINSSDMQVLYQYLIRSLLPSHPDLELQGGSLPGCSPGVNVNYGSFVTGPAHLMDQVASSSTAPKVFLSSGEGYDCFHLIVYRVLSATVCLFLDEKTDLTLKLFTKLEKYIGPRLTTLVSEISEHCVRNGPAATFDSNIKFIYFNNLNLAIKSSLLEVRKGAATSMSPELMSLLAAVYGDKSLFCDSGEIILNFTDSWIVVKVSNGREFYVISQKKSSLADISTEVKKICNTQLKGIFFMT